MRNSKAGFTLLEVLVAMTIFAFIAMGAQALLHTILTAREEAQRHTLRLAALQKALWIVERDIMQIEPGSVRPAGATAYALQFTLRGWRNPLNLPRGDRQIAAYDLRDGAFMRYGWPAGMAAVPPQTQQLLPDVKSLHINLAPGAVEVSLEAPPFGEVRRLIETPE